ncbi:GNAT family N-acetyltransferase [Sphingomonas abietis]|uniref:GNAT family N-acetyltransferase n=1 Tax=Sphingomonas abietis TaxID=3012344 RepID=A0ABY7NL09_9SPHN|nr:GNAT family N-acetyltransferase [Sphingomonas abietis]WBO22193.1 GNAT family N-acetyltransferase [Sphingomonas abietis]
MKRCAPGEVEIGWTFLATRCWGGAINGAMKRLMIEHAFGYVGTVLFFIGEDNLRSRRAVEKIGARLTERTIDPAIGGQVRRHLCYAIDRQG